MGGLGRALLWSALLAAAGSAVAEEWRQLSPPERYRTLENYEQHQRLPEQRQEAVQSQYERWRTMSPDEKDRVRQNFERFKRLPPNDRERFERKADKWRREHE